MFSWQICSNFVMLLCLYGPQSLNISSTLWNFYYKEGTFGRQKEVQPGTRKVYLIKCPWVYMLSRRGLWPTVLFLLLTTFSELSISAINVFISLRMTVLELLIENLLAVLQNCKTNILRPTLLLESNPLSLILYPVMGFTKHIWLNTVVIYINLIESV